MESMTPKEQFVHSMRVGTSSLGQNSQEQMDQFRCVVRTETGLVETWRGGSKWKKYLQYL